MFNHAIQDKKGLEAHPTLENGWIVNQTDNGFWIDTPTGRFPAQKAASCLLGPRPGDYVLTTMDTLGDRYVLAVLTRAKVENPSTDLEFTGPLNLRIKGAGLTVASEGEISVTSGAGLSLVQPRISLEAEEGSVAVSRLAFLGQVLKTRIGRIESMAESVEQIFARLTQKLVDCFRHVAQHEEVQTHSTRYLVEDTLIMQSRQAEHTAEEMVRINAEQIHMG